MNKILENLNNWFLRVILRRKYKRTGSCANCGACCSHIYVRHMKGVVKEEKEFEKLQLLHSFYGGLNVIGKDELGLIFECNYLDKETKLCKIHKHRPGICRRYPQEEIFEMGGCLSSDCGYKLTPIVEFKEIFDKISKKPLKEQKIIR